MSRHRFHGFIAGVGSTSGVRVVVGHWRRTPWGPFSDVMVETADGRRVLLAPHRQAADFVEATYTFDETRIEDVDVAVFAGAGDVGWAVRSPSLRLDLRFDRRTPAGVLLSLVPPAVAASPLWCTLTDPVARVAMRGVRTRGQAREHRREWYGATDSRRVSSSSGSFDGRDLGRLAPVDPPCRFGFSSTPRTPSVTTVVTTVDVDESGSLTG